MVALTAVFLHGLESSSKGTKAVWFKDRFPEMIVPDFAGTLADRMAVLRDLLAGLTDIVLVGSSFGGLMATVYVMEHPEKIRKVILLAPALNFPDFRIVPEPDKKIPVPAILYIGSRDDVCPPHIVMPTAQKVFSDLVVNVVDDDHMLHQTFSTIGWDNMLTV